jgi:hypothetical protein
VPFSGFAGNVNQSIRPFPHAGNIFMIWAPFGRTWYDSMQVKVTKRYSHGLDLSAAYSWQKELTVGGNFRYCFRGCNAGSQQYQRLRFQQDDFRAFNRIIIVGANYQVPQMDTNKFVSYALRDWTIGAVVTYQAGQPIMAPRAIPQPARMWAR